MSDLSVDAPVKRFLESQQTFAEFPKNPMAGDVSFFSTVPSAGEGAPPHNRFRQPSLVGAGRDFMAGFQRQFVFPHLIALAAGRDPDSLIEDALREYRAGDDTEDPNYDGLADTRWASFPPHMHRYAADARSYGESTIMISMLQKQLEKLRVVHEGGFASGFGEMVGFLSSELPTLFVTGPAAILALPMQTGINEAIFQEAQPDRSPLETTINVGISLAAGVVIATLTRGARSMNTPIDEVTASRFAEDMDAQVRAMEEGVQTFKSAERAFDDVFDTAQGPVFRQPDPFEDLARAADDLQDELARTRGTRRIDELDDDLARASEDEVTGISDDLLAESRRAEREEGAALVLSDVDKGLTAHLQPEATILAGLAGPEAKGAAKGLRTRIEAMLAPIRSALEKGDSKAARESIERVRAENKDLLKMTESAHASGLKEQGSIRYEGSEGFTQRAKDIASRKAADVHYEKALQRLRSVKDSDAAPVDKDSRAARAAGIGLVDKPGSIDGPFFTIDGRKLSRKQLDALTEDEFLDAFPGRSVKGSVASQAADEDLGLSLDQLRAWWTVTGAQARRKEFVDAVLDIKADVMKAADERTITEEAFFAYEALEDVLRNYLLDRRKFKSAQHHMEDFIEASQAIDDTALGMGAAGFPLNPAKLSKLRQSLAKVPESDRPRPAVTFAESVDDFSKAQNAADMKAAVGRMLDRGQITSKSAASINAVIDIMPENFFRELEFGAAVHGDKGVRGMYWFLDDAISVFGLPIAISTRKGGREGGQTFSHEMGHRVFFAMAEEADLQLGRVIFDFAQTRPKTKEFLANYKKSEHYAEWFAEEFGDYWTRRAKDGRDSAFSWLEGAYANKALGFESILENIAINVMKFIKRLAGHPEIQVSDVAILDAFFTNVTKKIGKKSAAKIIADLEPLGFIRTKRYQAAKEDDFLTRSKAGLDSTDDVTVNLASYSKATDEMPFEKAFRTSEGDERLLPAWLLEKLMDSPIKRLLMSSSPYARHIASYLVEHPFYQSMNVAGKTTPQGVDRNVAMAWVVPMVDALKETDEIYFRYRNRFFQESGGEGAGAHKGTIAQATADTFQGRGGALKRGEFMEEVGKAKRRLDRKEPSSSIPEATEAAKVWQEKLYGPAGVQAQELKIFSIKQRRRVDVLRVKLNDLFESTKERGMTKEQFEYSDSLNKQIKILEDEIRIADNFDLDPNFLNRLYNVTKIRENRGAFEAILVKEGGYTPTEAAIRTDTILNGRAFVPLEDDLTGMARSLKKRQILVDDIHIEEYLESNIAALGRYYATRIGADIELTRTFGSIDLREVLEKIRHEFDFKLRKVEPKFMDELEAYEALVKQQPDTPFIKPVPTTKKGKAVLKEKEQVIEDIHGIRDRIRGTYGIPEDPTTWTHRGIRVAKMWNATSLLTGAIAAVPDLGKLIFADGIKRTMGVAAESYRMGLRSNLKLAKREANLAGEALDMYLAMRSALFADLADSLSAATPFERRAGNMTQQFFNLALMNQWNESVKTMASLITGSRLIEESGKFAKGKISQLERTKLVNVGIDQETARVIAEQSKKHGLSGDHVRIAKTELWDNTPIVQEARRVYTAALGKDINRIIVTPGKGETPLFMSKPLWSLIFQFKTFAIAATHRTLTPGLQLKDMNFLHGNIALFGLGALINEIRRGQLDIKGDQSFGDWITASLERGGNVGILSDMNQILESLTDGRIGLRPILGAGRPSSTLAKGSALFGPTVQQGGNLARVLWDIGPGDADARTVDSGRRILYMGKAFWADGLFDLGEDGMNAVMGN